ncbi:MAG: diguanylate cyclase [Lachnospiraceae bacterium]|nr:diguanylate cyclase [Lachnospiraceae bacterium]
MSRMDSDEVKKNTANTKSIRLQTLVIIAVAVFILYTLIVLVVFSNNMSKANGDLADKVFDAQVELYLAKATGQLGGWRSASIGETQLLRENEGHADLNELLAHYVETSQAVAAAILDVNGQGTTTDGESIDISGVKGVQELPAGNCGMFVTKPGCVTAISALGTGEEKTGYLYLEYSLAVFRDEVFANAERDYWCVILDEEGTILYSSNPTKRNYINQGDDFFNTLKAADRDQGVMIIKDLMNTDSGKAVMELNGDERILYYNSSKMGQTWSVIMGVVDSSYKAVLAPAEGNVRNLAGFMVFGLLMFVGSLAYGYIKDSDVGKKKSEGLQHLAETDQLTGLFNKMTTEKKIREYVTENPNSQALMFVLDVDNFKKVNDTMGHAFGDQVLKEIGDGLKAQFRSSDIIGRAGGDEFIILLKDIKDTEILVREARKLEHFFQTLQVGGYVKYSATASIGCAIFSQDGQTFEELYKAADQALYQAKRRGKNQLAFFKEPEGFSQNA